MKHWNWRVLLRVVLIALVGAGLIPGCESGEKVVDEVTGNRAVKQYRKIEKAYCSSLAFFVYLYIIFSSLHPLTSHSSLY